jgi:ankyrin repeat protein
MGCTALHYSDFEASKLIIQAGANVNAIDCEKKTPLHTSSLDAGAWIDLCGSNSGSLFQCY